MDKKWHYVHAIIWGMMSAVSKLWTYYKRHHTLLICTIFGYITSCMTTVLKLEQYVLHTTTNAMEKVGINVPSSAVLESARIAQ